MAMACSSAGYVCCGESQAAPLLAGLAAGPQAASLKLAVCRLLQVLLCAGLTLGSTLCSNPIGLQLARCPLQNGKIPFVQRQQQQAHCNCVQAYAVCLLMLQCNLPARLPNMLRAPASAYITAGSKFPWAEALKPGNWITIPEPTTLSYKVSQQPDSALCYNAVVTSIESPAAFTGSVVDFLTDALLNEPSEYAFTVTADAFTGTDFCRAGKESGSAGDKLQRETRLGNLTNCDRLAEAALSTGH